MTSPTRQAPPESDERLRELKAALALAGLTLRQFCRQLGISTTHVYSVLRGQRESPRVAAAVARMIATHLEEAPTPTPEAPHA